MTTTATLMAQDNVIWQQGFSQSFFGVNVSAGIAIIVNDGNLFIEINLLGQRVRYNLCQTTYALEFGVGRFKVGIDNIEMSGNQLTAFCVKGELCIGFNVPIVGHREQCWTVVNQRIQVAAVSLAQVMGTAPMTMNLALDRVGPTDPIMYLTHATEL